MKIIVCFLMLLFASKVMGNMLIDPKKFDIIVKCEFINNEIVIYSIKNENEVPIDEIRENIPIKKNGSTWYVLRHETRNSDNEIIISYSTMLEAKKDVTYRILLPGLWMLEYTISLEEFDQYLHGNTPWIWKPKLISLSDQ